MLLNFQKYKKRPIVVLAAPLPQATDIDTLEGVMHVNAGDYIIIGVHGEKYPCKPSIFHATYDLVAGAEPVLPMCDWLNVSDENLEFWKTDCGNAFVVSNGSPIDNGMKYCPFCGKPLNPKYSYPFMITSLTQ